MIRVFIAAASAIGRAGLETLLRSQPGIAVTPSAEEADVVLAETAPENDDPPYGDAAIVVLADEPRPDWVREAVRSGVRAVLPRQAGEAEIVAAVHAAAAGLVVLEPQMLEPLLGAAAPARGAGAGPVEALTPREIEVLRLVAEGEGNKSIAYKLGISEHTVKFHVGSILGKLHASSRGEAVAAGIRQGLIML